MQTDSPRSIWCWLPLFCVSAMATWAAADELLPPANQRYALVGGRPEPTSGAPSAAPNFQRHVIPLLGRLGCNGRNCHGSFQGRGGFRLSMFGYDFAADHQALVGGDDPRVDLNDPPRSLILNKPTSELEHEGGLRYEKGGWQYHLLRRWIEAGAPNDSDRAGRIVRLEVVPDRLRFGRSGETAQLRVVAHWSDGVGEDVTCLTRFATNDESISQVSPDGLVRSIGKGATHIIASYDAAVVATQAILPVSQLVGPRYPRVPTPTRIDELVVAQWRELGIVPSPLCDDAEFLRRASLDVTGTLPTPREVLAFIRDDSTDRRQRKIDELLERPAYVAWWTTQLCDLTGLNASAQLGRTEIAPLAGELWKRWVERRVRENLGYDDVARGILLATSRPREQPYQQYVSAMTSYLRKVDQVDFAQQEMMPFYWFRANLATSEDKALAVAYSFLGVRLECAQCHKHPFDQWSQQDFQQFAAFFDRVTIGYAADAQQAREELEETVGLADFKNAAERRQTYRKLAAAGQEIVPWREVFIAPPAADGDSPLPKVLGGEVVRLDARQDPREPLVDWMLSKENRYFARAFVNRVWAHYFGVGVVDPPDDFNLGNPPSNAALLDYLAAQFVQQDYDMKWLHRTITNSRTYQLSRHAPVSNDTVTSALDTRYFSRALPRRLPAEVVVDAIAQATAGSGELAKAHQDVQRRKIAQQPPAYARAMEYALVVFGKPLRLTNCDCERQSDPSLQQAIYLRNDSDLWAMIDRKGGWLDELKTEPLEDRQLVRQVYLRALSRLPNQAEIERCLRHLAESDDHDDAARDLLWALLNTQEFVTNH